MSIKALYPCTGSFVLLGVSVMGYGIASGSLFIFAEGFYLSYLGVHMTWTLWEETHQELLVE